jgi:hypothetical protein
MMTIRVRAKDGSIQTFPSGTSEAAVRMAMLAYDNKESWGGMARHIANATGQKMESEEELSDGAGGFAAADPRQSPLYLRAAARLARPGLIPPLLDPTFIPGTPENSRVAGAFADAIEGVIGAVGQRPNPSAQSRADEYEAACLEQHRQDMVNCQTVRAVKGNAAWGACTAAAGQRLAECLNHGPNGINTPPYWRK